MMARKTNGKDPKPKKAKAPKFMDRLADVPKRAWIGLAVLAVIIMFAPLAWDFLKPVPEVTLPDDPAGRIVIRDDADLLTAEEEARLVQYMMPVAERGGVGFFTNPSDNPVGNVTSWAPQCYHEAFGNQSAVVFVIDMWSRQLYIYAGQDMLKVITPSKAETITDNIYRSASRGDYFSCAAEAFTQMAQLLQGGTVPEPMKHVSNAFLAFALALLAVFVPANLRTRMQGTDEKSVIHDAVRITHMTPFRKKLLKETRHLHVEASGSGGGGGGGGGFSGGGGGGGFSGGGGGHGF